VKVREVGGRISLLRAYTATTSLHFCKHFTSYPRWMGRFSRAVNWRALGAFSFFSVLRGSLLFDAPVPPSRSSCAVRRSATAAQRISRCAATYHACGACSAA